METNEAPRRCAAIGQVHRAHPRCPRCRKSLYKSPDVGARVRKRDAYSWCRNAECKLYGRDISRVVRIGDVLINLVERADRAALVAMLEEAP